MLFRSVLLAGSLLAGAAHAQGDVYALGEVQVTARNAAGETIGGSTVKGETLRKFDKASVDQALDLIPGAAAGNSGGSRNERLVFIRGFDRFQTTLSIDGVRVFLPADNRIDFARFLTADLSEVQVSKGYVSVLDGPGGLGGAINLVTRKPAKPFEGEIRLGAGFDGDGSLSSNTVSGRIGGKTDRFYVQASGARSERTHWKLPDDYRATALENGGNRDHSENEDWRVNLKAGFTPNADDEYSLTYTRQEGEKNAPYHVTDTASTRYWSWPYWNIDSLALLTRTKIADNAVLKARVYRNTFENALFSWDNARQNSQTLGRAFRSYYDDVAYGGNLELDVDVTASNTLKAAAFYRRDKHVEWQQSFAPAGTEPRQTVVEDTTSIALEDTQRFGDKVDLVVGVSRDRRDLNQAQDYNSNAFVFYPLTDDVAWNGQAALVWRPLPDVQLHGSVSSRARFPTLFERYSARMGQAVPNPDVKAERAINYELGGSVDFTPLLKIEGAVFYSDVRDALILIPVALGAPYGTVNQTKNAGDGEYYGLEGAATFKASDHLTLGGNYTYLHRKLTDPTNAAFRPTGTPDHKLFVYADWTLNDRISLTSSLETASKRWTVTSSSLVSPARYYRTGGYVLANLTAQVTVTPKIDVIVGARNLLDQKYQLVDGFPEEGRNFRADLRVKF
ncbi:TonB-dependent receptor [Caulobacter sp. 602-2]|uniref:TonB-dependent receptor n=1 Tax=Caulobacter sp. 602-2 TaxID=2710887 RepID=A0A6G4QYN7_9CAUL|nr:TonB-dependent receptor [Caulobacter sp. 602-2]NGM50569.1 TonB-dependent receptor [Caulobacter sp. 602-2]